jgi:hypothetical protein
MVIGGCQTCKELLNAAQIATVRHVDAKSKLRMAEMRYEHEAIPALEAAVEEARWKREEALAALHGHFNSHSGLLSKLLGRLERASQSSFYQVRERDRADSDRNRR